MEEMPFSVATLMEIFRFISSPIVPHVASENAQIGGYGVLKDTIIFINNYELNTSEKYWKNPEKFDPERFLEPAHQVKKDDFGDTSEILRVKKNIPHYLPFSVGKRSCIGQNIVRNFSFLMLTHILEGFDVASDNLDNIKMYPASVALPPETYALKFTPRN
jgi:cytochrome P450 family 307 subfamily A